MKIAVIGSGISGLSSAYFLSKKFKVDLFEKDDHFGGHSFTYEIKENDKIIPVDLGFIVFNELTYPNLINFFKELTLPTSLQEVAKLTITTSEILKKFKYDKKNKNNQLTFILNEKIGKSFIKNNMDENILIEFLNDEI